MASFLNRLYDAIRHPAAASVSARRETVAGFEHLRGHKYCLLVSYRRDGDAVPTPVWFGLGGGKVYIRTGAELAKVKRVRNDPRVRLAPCDARGRPGGAPAEGRARVLEHRSPDERDAEAALQSNYGLGRRIYVRVAGAPVENVAYIEVTPVQAAPAPPPRGA